MRSSDCQHLVYQFDFSRDLFGACRDGLLAIVAVEVNTRVVGDCHIVLCGPVCDFLNLRQPLLAW